MTTSNKDLTPAAATQWVAQEAENHKTEESAKERIKSETSFVAMIEGLGGPSEYQNSLKAHKKLIEVLGNKFK